jgi:hypothetical protein
VCLVAVAACAVGCGSTPGRASRSENLRAAEPAENFHQDIEHTDLEVDVASRTATATIRFKTSDSPGASFEAGGLDVHAVRGPDGEALPYRVVDGRLDVGVAADQLAEISVEYGFAIHQGFEGLQGSGVTFVWPYFCGNLFPCKSDPSDGLTFGLALTGVDQGIAVYPKEIVGEAPSYMVAWAVGDYTHVPLGQTDAGTSVSVYYLPGEQAVAERGTAHLVEVFDWLEKTYGAYTFGDDVASVSAHWGPGAFGGMEHHPYWHVSSDSMGDASTHAHEAAHGWFGAVSYLTARAREAVEGEAVGVEVWKEYDSRLDGAIASRDHLAWPDSCGEVDVLTELWSTVPYMKGAFFYRAVEQAVGRQALDRALARFYAEHAGHAAGMRDMLDTIEAETDFDATGLAYDWLRSLGRPDG